MKSSLKLIILFNLLTITTIVKGQFEISDLCDFGYIFKEEFFSDFQIEKHSHSYSDFSMRNEIDFYSPIVRDFCRPLILFIGGGFFVNVDKEGMVNHAKYFAKRGYQTAVINHRVVPWEQRCSDLGWWQAMQDVHAAIKYASALAEVYTWASFNNQKVILVGSSAGAVTALNLTFSNAVDMINYLPEASNKIGGLNHSVFEPYKDAPYKILGTISLAGAMTDIINTSSYDFNETASVLFIHSKNDRTVPYNMGKAGTCKENPISRNIFGPQQLIPRITNSRFDPQTLSLEGSQHVIPIEDHISSINSFIHKISTDKLKNDVLVDNQLKKHNYENKLSIYPNPSKGNFKVKIPFNNNQIKEGVTDKFFNDTNTPFNSPTGAYRVNKSTEEGRALIEISDTNGQIIQSSAYKIDYNGNNILSIQTTLKPGIYIIKINNAQKILTERLVITN